MSTTPAKDPVQVITETLLFLSGILAPVTEAMAGYKAQLQDQGFAESTAEQMCVDYHRLIIDKIRG